MVGPSRTDQGSNDDTTTVERTDRLEDDDDDDTGAAGTENNDNVNNDCSGVERGEKHEARGTMRSNKGGTSGRSSCSLRGNKGILLMVW